MSRTYETDYSQFIPSDAFRSARLRYRAFEASKDCELYERWFADPWSQINCTPNGPRVTATSTITKRMEGHVDRNLISAVICLPHEDDDSKPGKAIGHVILDKPSMFQHATSNFGIILDKEYRGKGYGSEATEWILEQAFKRHRIHRVTLEVYDFNPAAKRVYEKCGFVLEGTKREAYWLEGKWCDAYDMAILEKDYFARQTNNS
ncbi:hypothetical protein MNV49_000009 [Pseudohyphozyma bogoriensis]|nr:hypothetical protein MNV49_000009 [Pseudohyphozyma bogoriensis]